MITSRTRAAGRPVAALATALAVACPLAVACTSSVVSVADDEIVGEWTWMRSTGGIAGTTRTPETEGFTGVLRFGVDGTVEWRVDGELRWSTTWVLGRAGEGSPLAGKEVVRYGAPVVGWDEQAVRIEDGKLVLTDPCCDGFVHEYEAVGS